MKTSAIHREMDPVASRELAIFEISAERAIRTKIIEIASVFRARLLDSTDTSLTMEASGLPEEIDALEELLSDWGLVRVVRTGPISLTRQGWVFDAAATGARGAERPSMTLASANRGNR